MKFTQNLLFVIAMYIFSNADMCLYGMESSSDSCSKVADEDTLAGELKNSIMNKTINIIAMKRFLPIGINIFVFDEDKINEVFEKIDRKILKDQWTLIVFSEYFFGESALDNSRVKYIVKKCTELTKRYEKLIVHVNFLHKFDINESDCPAWIKDEKYVPIAASEINGRLINTEKHCDFLPVDTSHPKRVANYSLVIWNDRPISIYRKSTYCNEANDVVNPYAGIIATHAYEFGNFETIKLINDEMPGEKIASLFTEDTALLVTRICADMNKSDFLEASHLKEILILPAKEAPNFNSLNTITIQVDDNTRLNMYLVLKYNDNYTLLSPYSQILDARYLGMCFNLASITYSNQIIKINSYFFDRPNQQNDLSSGEGDGCCCGCCL